MVKECTQSTGKLSLGGLPRNSVIRIPSQHGLSFFLGEIKQQIKQTALLTHAYLYENLGPFYYSIKLMLILYIFFVAEYHNSLSCIVIMVILNCDGSLLTLSAMLLSRYLFSIFLFIINSSLLVITKKNG